MKYSNILRKVLGREPNFIEHQVFSITWSEHCGYSHTKAYIKRLPKKGHGGNAGVVDLDEYNVIAFKIESHNHPSAIEPYNGAATGVGGIIRDILATGVRPTAILDSLHMNKIIDGIIEGIGDYGNSIGVPTVGGELRITNLYKYNPLVNVMAVGVGKRSHVVPSCVQKKGQVIVILGKATGRDGIHGASFASEDLTGEKATKLSIQVGDPFAEKMLMESFLRMIEEDLVEGAQDLGAGGILTATAELAEKGGLGVALYLENVPLREFSMEPWEILISESQERMAIVTSEKKARRIIEIAKKNFLHAEVVAKVIEEPFYRVYYKNKKILDLPIDILVNPPEESAIEYIPPDFPDFDWINFKDIDAHEVFERYDYMVGTNTLVPPGMGAAIMRAKENVGYSLLTHSRADIAFQNAYWGTYIAVLESIRKSLAVGAEPLAITNCVNYGDPDKDPTCLSAMMKALKDACIFADIPVASGNASLYNTYRGKHIPPTLVIGVVGKVEPYKIPRLKSSKIFAVGWHDFNPEREKNLWKTIKKAVNEGKYVLTSSKLLKKTHFETIKRMGCHLDIKIPKVEPAHQMVLVFGNKFCSDIPVKEIGELK